MILIRHWFATSATDPLRIKTRILIPRWPRAAQPSKEAAEALELWLFEAR